MFIAASRGHLRPYRFFVCCVAVLLAGLFHETGNADAQSGPLASTTSLQVLSGGVSVSTVNAGTVVRLRASVAANGAALGGGTVQFCDASAPFCTGVHLLGTVPVTAQGVASMRFRPAAGDHEYKAVYSGMATALASTSASTSLTVTQTRPTTTTLDFSGSAGDYTLNSTVSATAGAGSAEALSGQSVSLLDQTNGDAVLGTATLGQASLAVNWKGTSLTAGPQPTSVSTGDFNGDGIADIAVISGPQGLAGDPPVNGTVNIYLGKGDGTFTEAPGSPITVGSNPQQAGVMDLNGDGIQDLVVLNFQTQNVSVLLGVGDGTFTAAPGSPFMAGGNVDPYGVAFGDFNRDGKMDMAIAGWGEQTDTTGAISIFLGNGDGTFRPPLLVPLGPLPLYATYIVAWDFNGDGIPDLAVPRIEEDKVSILLGNGDGTFQEAASSPIALPAGSMPSTVVTTDFNGDGIADLAIKNVGDGSTTVLLGTAAGDGSFTRIDSNNLSNAEFTGLNSIAAGDFNGDGIPDIALAGYPNTGLSVFFGVGDGTFTKAANTANAGDEAVAFAVADFNGDGINDLVAADISGNNATVLTTAVDVQAAATADKISPLGTGVHKVFAQFAAVGDLGASQSPVVDLIASAGAPSMTLTPSASSILTTDALPVSVKVSGGPANPVPTGTVKLTSGTYASGNATLANGSATITIPGGSLPGGTDVIAAAYTPDTAGAATYVAGTASSAAITVTKVTPSMSVSAASASVKTVDSLVVTVKLTNAPSPTGTAQLTSGGYTSAATALSQGSASVTIPAGSLAAGSDTITATYTPNAASTPIYNGATATSGQITVSKVTPSITATASATVITDQQPVTVNIAVGASGQPAASGSIAVASEAYSATGNLVNGTVSIKIPAGALAVGSDTITMTYSGDALYNAGNASTSVTVSSVAASSTTPSNIAEGGSGTATITVNAGSTYKGTLNLTCTLTSSPAGAQKLPTCSLNPTMLSFTAAGSATTTLTVNTMAASASVQSGDGLPWRPFGAVALGALFVIALPRRRRWSAWLVVLFAAIGMAAVGCGGGTNSAPKPPATPGTTPGTYVFTVNAADSVDATISTSTDVSFTVQ